MKYTLKNLFYFLFSRTKKPSSGWGIRQGIDGTLSGTDLATAGGSGRTFGRNGAGLDDLMAQDFMDRRQQRLDASQTKKNDEVFGRKC